MFNIQIIQAQIQYWGDVLEEPQSYNDETVGTAPDQLAFWREQLEKAQKKQKVQNTILNLTRHNPTPEQIAEGVIELFPEYKKTVVELLTFSSLPTQEEITRRADKIAQVAIELGATKVMIGGAPYLMCQLENALKERGIEPFYSFTGSVVVETANPETGEVTKTSVFKHLGFVPA